MDKPSQPFFDRFTATQDRPRAFQILTIILVLMFLLVAATGFIHLLLAQ